MFLDVGPNSSSARGPVTKTLGCHRSEVSTRGKPQDAQGSDAEAMRLSMSVPPGREPRNPVASNTRSAGMETPLVSVRTDAGCGLGGAMRMFWLGIGLMGCGPIADVLPVEEP